MLYDKMTQEQLEERRQELVQTLSEFSNGDDRHQSEIEDEIGLIDKALERFS